MMPTPDTIDFATLTAPIPGSSPVGEYLAYEKVYDQIKEARRSDDPTLTDKSGDWKQKIVKTADWKTVVKLTTETLIKKSKDLQLAAWLGEALIKRAGFAGVRDAFRLVHRLMDAYWDSVHPQIEDDDRELRAAPLGWMTKNYVTPLMQIPLTAFGGASEYTLIDYEHAQNIDNLYRKNPDAAEALKAEGKITLEQFNKGVAETPSDFLRELIADFREAQSAIEQFTSFCDEKLESDAPSVEDLKKGLNSLELLLTRIEGERGLAAAPAEPAAEESSGASDDSSGSSDSSSSDSNYRDSSYRDGGSSYSPSAQPSAPSAPTPAARPTRRGGPLPPEPTSKEDALERIAAAANWLRQQEPTSPVSYLVVRAMRWGELRADPQPPEPERYAAPPSEVRQKLRSLKSNNDWSALLAETEAAAALPCGRAWLDGHRFAAEALRNVGYEYTPAADAMVWWLRAVVAGDPNLPDAELADGTPSANAETKRWLTENNILGGFSTGGSAGTSNGGSSNGSGSSSSHPEPAAPPPPPPPPPPPMAATNGSSDGSASSDEAALWERASELVQSGRFSDGLRVVQARLAGARSGRERYMLNLQMAELCLLGERPKGALSVLEDLFSQIEVYKLEDWESRDLVVRVYNTLCQCYRRLENVVPGSDEKFRQVHARLFRLDPAQALAWGEF